MDMVKYMSSIIRAAGKKDYKLVVGKPSPAKLANFPDIDIFVCACIDEIRD